ncbi:GlsB/YeaQ/YmgE family stress response membrane protein [soil metagenome]
MSILSFILYLIVAAVCAWIAAAVVPGRVPGGFFTAAIFGIIGAWIGSSLMGSFGPVVESVAVVPAIIGSGLLIFMLTFLTRSAKTI